MGNNTNNIFRNIKISTKFLPTEDIYTQEAEIHWSFDFVGSHFSNKMFCMDIFDIDSIPFIFKEISEQLQIDIKKLKEINVPKSF